MKNILEIRILDSNNVWQKYVLPDNANVINGEGDVSVAQKSYDLANAEKYKAIASGVQSVAFGGYRYDYFKAYSVYQKASSTVDDWGGDFYFTATYYQSRDSKTKSLTIYKRNSAGTATHSLSVEPRDTADDPIEITIDSNVYTLRMLFSDDEMILFRMDGILFTIEEGQPTTEARGDQSAAFGGGNLAGADFTFVAGKNNKVYQEGSVAFGGGNTAGKVDGERGATVCAAVFGADSSATGSQSFAAGNRVHAVGDQSVAFGQSNRAEGTRSFVAGHNSKAVGNAAIALGSGAIAQKSGSFATGTECKAYGISAIAMGNYSVAGTVVKDGDTETYSGDYAIAIGNKASAPLGYTIAVGSESSVSGEYGIAIGNKCKADESSSVAIGRNNTAKEGAVALGYNATATGKGAIAIGGTASGIKAVTLGAGTVASGNYSFASGESSVAAGSHSFSVGQVNNVQGDFSTAFGSSQKIDAASKYSFAAGRLHELVNAPNSFVAGIKCYAGASAATAIGNENKVYAGNGVALGAYNHINGNSSVALGNYNRSNGYCSTTSGYYNIADSAYSTAIGANNRTKMLHDIAIGANNKANGRYAIAFGSYNTVNGYRSTAIGYGNSTGVYDQFVCGRFAATQPDSSTDAAFVVGYGPAKPKNANTFLNVNDIIGYYCIYNGEKVQITKDNCSAVWSDSSITEVYSHNTVFAALRDGRAKIYGEPIYDDDAVNLKYLKKTFYSPSVSEIGADKEIVLSIDDKDSVKGYRIQSPYGGPKPFSLIQTDMYGSLILPDPVAGANPVTLQYFDAHIGDSGLTVDEQIKINKLIIDGNGDKFLANDGTYKEVGGGSVSGDYVPVDAPIYNNYLSSGSTVYAKDSDGNPIAIPVQTFDVDSFDDLAPYGILVADEDGYHHFKDPIADSNPVTLGYLRDNVASAGQHIRIYAAKSTDVTYSIYYHSSLGIENEIREVTTSGSLAIPIERSGVVAFVIHSASSYGAGGSDNPSISGVFMKEGGIINLDDNISYSYGQVVVPLDSIIVNIK